MPPAKPPPMPGMICGLKAETKSPPLAAASATGDDNPTLEASAIPTRTATDKITAG